MGTAVCVMAVTAQWRRRNVQRRLGKLARGPRDSDGARATAAWRCGPRVWWRDSAGARARQHDDRRKISKIIKCELVEPLVRVEIFYFRYNFNFWQKRNPSVTFIFPTKNLLVSKFCKKFYHFPMDYGPSIKILSII